MTSSSSSSTSVSSSEYASTCSTAAGEDALALLDSPSAIAPLYDDVRRTGEPSIPGVFPVAMSKNFSNVLGWYRQLRRQLIGTGSGSPRFPPTSCGAREAARWLLLLAFTMWFAPGHYTAWIDRLEMVCSSTWARATREQLLSSLASSPSHHLRAICKSWLPTEADVCVPATTTSSSSPRFSIWRAVSWELRCTGWILRRRVKGFQIWFHRKELIQRALNTIHPDHRDHLLSRQDLFDAYLMEEAGITFSDVDERVVVEAIVRDVDSKNYHGWEHRAWFLDHFPFLCRGPTWMELLEHWSRAAAAGVPMKMEGFVVDVMWLARPGTGSITWLPTDSYPVLGELDFTATRLPDDPWNNSVWSAHMSVWVDHFIRPLLHEYASVEGLVGCEAAMKMLHHLARPQMTMALQWAVCHPCNQPPLFSARVVAEKFHTASLRLMLFHHLPATEEYAHIHGALLKEVGSLANARCSATDASFIITGISAWISPASYLSTFALMELYEDVLVRHVCPAADGILDEVMELLGVEDEAERQERVRTSLYAGEATQFILDHCFEPTAARYHSIFVFLHETWLMYFTDVQRANIARDHPLDADHLGTLQTPTPEDEDEVVGAFLRKEREALRLARELREFDPIRAKYWRNEVFVVLHRRY